MSNDEMYLTFALAGLNMHGHDLTYPSKTLTYSGWKVKCKRCKMKFKLIPGKTTEQDLNVPCPKSRHSF